MKSRVLLAACAALALPLAAGCGGSGDGRAPAAEPARSPPLTERPAGRVVNVGNKPEGLVFDPATGLLAVGLTNFDQLALVDGRSGRVVRRITLPEAPRHLALAAPGGPVLVPSEKSNELVEVWLPGGRLRATEVGRFPHDAGAAGGRIFVGDELGHTLSVLERGRRIATLPAPRQPGGVAVTADGRHVAVVGVRERAIEVFDTATLRSLGRVSVGIGPTHVVAVGRRFFVVDTRGNSLLELRLDPLRVHRRTHLEGAPYGIAVDTSRATPRFWVTLTARNRVVELTDRHALRSLPTVSQPNSVAVDPASGRVFVADRKLGTLQIIDTR